MRGLSSLSNAVTHADEKVTDTFNSAVGGLGDEAKRVGGGLRDLGECAADAQCLANGMNPKQAPERFRAMAEDEWNFCTGAGVARGAGRCADILFASLKGLKAAGAAARGARGARAGEAAGAGGGLSAYDEAAAGGRHAGFLRNYQGRSPQELDRGVRSIDKQIGKHEEWIKNPEQKIPEWNRLDPRKQQDLLTNKWPGDIQRLREQQEILRHLSRGG
jgi:hypothetical protein